MKKALMAAALAAIVCTPAHAETWSNVAIEGGGDARWSMDWDTYTTSGAVARFIARREENNGNWAMMVLEVNCRAIAYRVGPMNTYSGRSLTGSSRDFQPWKYVATNTLATYFVNEVCE